MAKSAKGCECGKETKTILVYGEAYESGPAEKVWIYPTVIEEKDTASEAQTEGAKKVEDMKKALKAFKIDKAETTYYNFLEIRYPNIPYPGPAADMKLKYRLTHCLAISSENLDSTGKVVDALVGAGASSISIGFSLKPETYNKLRKKALEKAAKEARNTAESIATGLGVKIIGMRSSSETGGRGGYARGADKFKAEEGSTSITPSTSYVSVRLDVEFLVG